MKTKMLYITEDATLDELKQFVSLVVDMIQEGYTVESLSTLDDGTRVAYFAAKDTVTA